MPRSTKTTSSSTAAAKAPAGSKAAAKKAAAASNGTAEPVTADAVVADRTGTPEAGAGSAGSPAGGDAGSGASTDSGSAEGTTGVATPDAKPAVAAPAARSAAGRAATPKVAPKPKVRESDDPFLVSQRELLMAERSNYVSQAEELKAQADSLALEHEPGDVQFDEEGGEGGTSNVDRELDLLLSAQARGAVEEIDRALVKMESGTYGRCEQCGQDIPEARLEALPHAALCVVCKAGGLSSRR